MACNSINSTLELFSLALLLILSCSIFLKQEKNRLDKQLYLVLLLHFLNTCGDLAAWRFTGQSSALAFMMTSAGNFLTYCFGPLSYSGFLFLVYHSIIQKNTLKPSGIPVAALMAFLCLFNMGLVFYNFHIPILFHIDASNTFTWGPLCTLPDNLVLLQSLLLYPLLLINRRESYRKTTFLYLICCGPLAAAAAIENIYQTLMLLYPVVSVGLIVIFIRSSHEMEKQLLAQKLELSDNRARLLLAQIQPHFLFNSLLAIKELCHENPEKAENALQDFSGYLRGNLESLNGSRLIPFEKEVQHVQCYLALEQADPACGFQINLDLKATGFLLPPLSVQPLVENAIRHGITGLEGNGRLSLKSWETENAYQIFIEDNGPGFSSESTPAAERTRVGISNVRARLELLCGGSLTYSSRPGSTQALITIPKRSQTL